MLHVGPERAFIPRFRKYPNLVYLTADLYDSRAMIKMDIEKICFPGMSFDVIYCCHVLEHVRNDMQAVNEFFRVLKPNGWALIVVPIMAKSTIEDLGASPKKRKKLFGQSDHLRAYGTDFMNRLERSGFKVKRFCASDFLTQNDIFYMGLPDDSCLFFCQKHSL